MNIQVQGSGAFDSARIELEPGEQFVSESGAMYRASANVDIDVTTRSRGGGGGLLAGAKRLLARENFFFSTYRTTDGSRGEVGIAPTHQGQIRLVEVGADADWYCSGGSYLGSTQGLAVDTEFQGFKGLLSGESLFFLRVSGTGQLLVSSFGRIVQMEVEEPTTVDTGHLVAFESSLSYTIRKAAGSWLQSMFSGEGLVMQFTGRGRILTQSHNPKEFGTRLGPLLPTRKN